MKDIKLISLGISISTILFLVDMLFSLSIFSVFYILVIYLAFFFSSKETVFGFMLLTLMLTLISLPGSSDINFRIMSILMIIISGTISLMQMSSTDKLRALNNSLELKVLARTTNSYAKVTFLENQIRILQAIRSSDTSDSVRNLDNVISELKKIKDMEISDG